MASTDFSHCDQKHYSVMTMLKLNSVFISFSGLRFLLSLTQQFVFLFCSGRRCATLRELRDGHEAGRGGAGAMKGITWCTARTVRASRRIGARDAVA